MRELLSENLKTARKEARFTQEKLAEAASVSLRMLQDIEGQNSWPSPEMIEKLAKALGIDEARLFRDPKIEPTPQEALVVLRKALETTPVDLKSLWESASEPRRKAALRMLAGPEKMEKAKSSS